MVGAGAGQVHGQGRGVDGQALDPSVGVCAKTMLAILESCSD